LFRKEVQALVEAFIGDIEVEVVAVRNILHLSEYLLNCQENHSIFRKILSAYNIGTLTAKKAAWTEYICMYRAV